MAIQFSCPSCHTPYTVDDKNAGKKSNCAKCGQRIQVPAPPRNRTVLGEIAPDAKRNKTVLGELPSALAVTSRPDSSRNTVPVVCPGCGHRAEAAARFAGSVAKCPKCDTSFTIGERVAATDRTGEQQISPVRTVASYDSGRGEVEDDYRDDFSPNLPRRRTTSGQGLAIASLIVGICGIFVAILSGGPVLCAMCCLAFAAISWVVSGVAGLLGVIGLVLGFASRSAGNRSGMSTGGIVTSVIAVLLAIIGIILPLVFPAAAIVTAPPPQQGQPNWNRPDGNKPPGDKPDTQRPPAKKADNSKQPAPTERKTYTREEFRRLVVGKTPNGVINAVGKPDDTQNLSASVVWYYDRITTDPATGRIDAQAQVIFEKGKVTRVNY